jgi:hypothetical protein
MDLAKVSKLLLENSFHGYIFLSKMMKLLNSHPWLPMNHEKTMNSSFSSPLFLGQRKLNSLVRLLSLFHCGGYKMHSEHERCLAQIKENITCNFKNALESLKDLIHLILINIH